MRDIVLEQVRVELGAHTARTRAHWNRTLTFSGLHCACEKFELKIYKESILIDREKSRIYFYSAAQIFKWVKLLLEIIIKLREQLQPHEKSN